MKKGLFCCSLYFTYIHALQGMIHEKFFTFLSVHFFLKTTKEPALYTQSFTIIFE